MYTLLGLEMLKVKNHAGALCVDIWVYWSVWAKKYSYFGHQINFLQPYVDIGMFMEEALRRMPEPALGPRQIRRDLLTNPDPNLAENLHF